MIIKKIDFSRYIRERLEEVGITSRQAIKIIKVPDFTFRKDNIVEARRQVNGKIFALTYSIHCNEIRVISIEEKDSFY